MRWKMWKSTNAIGIIQYTKRMIQTKLFEAKLPFLGSKLLYIYTPQNLGQLFIENCWKWNQQLLFVINEAESIDKKILERDEIINIQSR